MIYLFIYSFLNNLFRWICLIVSFQSLSPTIFGGYHQKWSTNSQKYNKFVLGFLFVKAEEN